MIRLCAFGNSHLASLKSGWESLRPSAPDVSVTFFGSRQMGLNGLCVQDGRLVPDSERLQKDIAFTSGGLTAVDPTDYDVFMIYALSFLPPQLPSDGAFSAGFIEACCNECFETSLAYKLGKRLRSISDKRIIIAHTSLNAGHAEIRALGDYSTIEPCLRKAVAERGFEFVAQPPVTISERQFTKLEYSVGSRRLDIGDAVSNHLHPRSDLEHMNGDYGRLLMSEVLRLIRSAR